MEPCITSGWMYTSRRSVIVRYNRTATRVRHTLRVRTIYTAQIQF